LSQLCRNIIPYPALDIDKLARAQGLPEQQKRIAIDFLMTTDFRNGAYLLF
jgi:hypothetical protein